MEPAAAAATVDAPSEDQQQRDTVMTPATELEAHEQRASMADTVRAPPLEAGQSASAPPKAAAPKMRIAVSAIDELVAAAASGTAEISPQAVQSANHSPPTLQAMRSQVDATFSLLTAQLVELVRREREHVANTGMAESIGMEPQYKSRLLGCMQHLQSDLQEMLLPTRPPPEPPQAFPTVETLAPGKPVAIQQANGQVVYIDPAAPVAVSMERNGGQIPLVAHPPPPRKRKRQEKKQSEGEQKEPSVTRLEEPVDVVEPAQDDAIPSEPSILQIPRVRKPSTFYMDTEEDPSAGAAGSDSLHSDGSTARFLCPCCPANFAMCSRRTIRAHVMKCAVEQYPEWEGKDYSGLVEALSAVVGRNALRGFAFRKHAVKRNIKDIAFSQRWYCPYEDRGCNVFFAKSSSNSRQMHVAKCQYHRKPICLSESQMAVRKSRQKEDDDRHRRTMGVPADGSVSMSSPPKKSREKPASSSTTAATKPTHSGAAILSAAAAVSSGDLEPPTLDQQTLIVMAWRTRNAATAAADEQPIKMKKKKKKQKVDVTTSSSSSTTAE
jgi:hypothetical protein